MRMKYMLSVLFMCAAAFTQAQQIFEQFDFFFHRHVSTEGRVNYAGIQPQELENLHQAIDRYVLADQPEAHQKAFLINAYNIFVISSVVVKQERSSVQNHSNFFTEESFSLGGKRLSLNQIEKDILFKIHADPRLHFVLVCGAVSCPPIINQAYFPTTLENDLDRQTRAAVNDPAFVRFNRETNTVEWSALFDWYAQDFGANRSDIIAWINTYRTEAIPSDAKAKVLPYDWSLNIQNGQLRSQDLPAERATNSIRYVVSSTIKKGSTETKVFNNLYTQATGDGSTLNARSNFFTTFITSLYGVSDRFNAGLELRYRRVSNTGFPSSPLTVFDNVMAGQSRQSFATIGPKIRWAPVPKWGNFSIQSGFWIPLENDLEGGNGESYIDWNGFTSWTQIMNDFTLGQRFSLFTEVSFLWEDIGTMGDRVDLNRLSTPLTVIASYFPEPKTTLYILNGFSPYWSPDLDWFYQVGAGAKYQFSPKFEVELLYTKFTNSFLVENNGRAATFNFGIRINT